MSGGRVEEIERGESGMGGRSRRERRGMDTSVVLV
jgi:hypothetical protein